MVSYSAIPGESSNASDTSRGRRSAKGSIKQLPPLTSPRRRTSRTLKDQIHAGQASWISSCINLVNTIIGSGILASPLALSHMGIVLGTFVILWSGFASGFGLYLQTRCAKYLERGSSSFFALSQITYPNAAVIFDAAIAIKCFGVGVSYLIIIGDLMPGVVRGFVSGADETPFLVDRHFWVTVFMLVVIPLAFLKRLDSLKYTSVIALISIGYLVVLVVYHFFKGDTKADRGPIRVITWAGLIPTLQSFPVIVFAYTCHQNMFSILNEIQDNSSKRTTGVVVTSIGSAAFLYVLVAITGYLSFGNSIVGNIVSMYSASVASTIAKAAIVVLVMFSYPLQVHPCRASIDAVLKWRPSRHSSSRNTSPARTIPLLTPSSANGPVRNDSISELRFAVLTTVIIILSYITAMTVSSLDKVLAYVGSTGSTSISFILPGLFYYKISDPNGPQRQWLAKEDDDEDVDEDDEEAAVGGEAKSQWRKGLLRKASLGLAIYGVFVMIVCLSTNLFFSAAPK